jgi:hypothetical protein
VTVPLQLILDLGGISFSMIDLFNNPSEKVPFQLSFSEFYSTLTPRACCCNLPKCVEILRIGKNEKKSGIIQTQLKFSYQS